MPFPAFFDVPIRSRDMLADVEGVERICLSLHLHNHQRDVVRLRGRAGIGPDLRNQTVQDLPGRSFPVLPQEGTEPLFAKGLVLFVECLGDTVRVQDKEVAMPDILLVVLVVTLFLRFTSTECIYPQRPKSTINPKKTKSPKDGDLRMIKTGEQPTEKILVTPATKQDLNVLKQPGERYGDVVARLVHEQKQQDYIAQILRVAKEGDFVPMESDDEYRKIRKEVLNIAPRNRKAGTAIH